MKFQLNIKLSACTFRNTTYKKTSQASRSFLYFLYLQSTIYQHLHLQTRHYIYWPNIIQLEIKLSLLDPYLYIEFLFSLPIILLHFELLRDVN